LHRAISSQVHLNGPPTALLIGYELDSG
jgi:hypothetical protein